MNINRRSILYIIIMNLLLTSLVCSAEIYNYTVNLLFIPSLNLKMKIVPMQNDQTKLEFTANTNDFFDGFYKVENYYECIYNSENCLPQSRTKEIDQPRFRQQLSANYINSQINYSNGKAVDLSGPTYSFLSMLMYLRSKNGNDLASESIKVEVEGKFYRAIFHIVGQDEIKINEQKTLVNIIDIELEKLKSFQPVVKQSDLFFENVVNLEGKRRVWVEQGGARRIVKAKFSLKGTWLVAKLKGGRHQQNK